MSAAEISRIAGKTLTRIAVLCGIAPFDAMRPAPGGDCHRPSPARIGDLVPCACPKTAIEAAA